MVSVLLTMNIQESNLLLLFETLKKFFTTGNIIGGASEFFY